MCGLLSLKRPFCSWNVERRDWCVVDEADVVLFGEHDAVGGCCINWFPIDCRRFLNMLFSSCNFFIWFVSISTRVSVGCGIHWNIVARKLWSDTSNVSCHCFVKQTANTACSSGFLQNGKTRRKKRHLFIREKIVFFYGKGSNHLQNQSFHSDSECSSGANFEKKSVILSCFPAEYAVTKYSLSKPVSNFLTAFRVKKGRQQRKQLECPRKISWNQYWLNHLLQKHAQVY